MKIFIGSDHAGFGLKKTLIEYLHDLGHDVRDMGPKTYVPDDDYPDYIVPVAKAVATEAKTFGIVLGGSGQGEAMIANKVPGVRAVVYYGGNTDIIRFSREHNDANILSLGARFVHEDEAKKMISLWLATPFSKDTRHVRRLEKVAQMLK